MGRPCRSPRGLRRAREQAEMRTNGKIHWRRTNDHRRYNLKYFDVPISSICACPHPRPQLIVAQRLKVVPEKSKLGATTNSGYWQSSKTTTLALRSRLAACQSRLLR